MKWILLITKGLIREQHARRQCMFSLTLAALVGLLLGSTLLQGWLREHVLMFVLYWAGIAWLTLAVALLALFDLLLLRSAEKKERRLLKQMLVRAALEEESDRDDPSDKPPGPATPG